MGVSLRVCLTLSNTMVDETSSSNSESSNTTSSVTTSSITTSNTSNTVGGVTTSNNGCGGLSADLLYNILALLCSGGVHHSRGLGGALMFLSTLLLFSALLLCGALFHLGALLLRYLGALLLWDLLHNIVTLWLCGRSANIFGNLPRYSLTLFHGSATALLLLSCLNVGDSPGVTDCLRYSVTHLTSHCIVSSLTVGSYCHGGSQTQTITGVSISICQGQGRGDDQ